MTFLVIQTIAIISAVFYMTGIWRLISGLRRLSKPNADFTPRASIIVSLHNEEKNIPGLLKHLLVQEYPAENLEIILVDDRSQDETSTLLQKYEKQHPQIKVLQIKETPDDYAPKKYAITRAVEIAHGEILCFTDADGRPEPEWVKSLVRYFDRKTGMVLGYAPYTSDTFLHRILALEYLSHAAVAAASSGLNHPITCVGTNLAYRKRVFTEMDGFGKFRHVHTGDDDLFLQRVRDESDWRIKYATSLNSQVHNAPPRNWTQFYNQRLRYASKGFLYPKIVTLILTLFYFYNLMLLLSLLSILIFPPGICLFTFLFVPKLLGDFYFMYKTGIFLHDTRHRYLIPVAIMLHIPYVLYFGAMAQVQGYQWAGRKG